MNGWQDKLHSKMRWIFQEAWQELFSEGSLVAFSAPEEQRSLDLEREFVRRLFSRFSSKNQKNIVL
jgi:hypothetical protein